MKLPLLGIMLVLLVQLGYTAYNAVDRPLEALMAVNPVTSGTNPVATTDLDDHSSGYRNTDWAYHPAVAVANRRRSGSAEEAFVSAKRSPATRSIRMSRLVAEQRPFESTTIFYPGQRPGGELELSHAESHQPITARAIETRSFASKSFAVIKKPFDWLKTLGSKLR